MQLSARVVVGIVSFSVAMTGCVLANFFLTMMIGEINRKREEGRQVSYFGMTPPKMLRIFREYRSSFASGNLDTLALTSFAVAVAALISMAVCMGLVG